MRITPTTPPGLEAAPPVFQELLPAPVVLRPAGHPGVIADPGARRTRAKGVFAAGATFYKIRPAEPEGKMRLSGTRSAYIRRVSSPRAVCFSPGASGWHILSRPEKSARQAPGTIRTFHNITQKFARNCPGSVFLQVYYIEAGRFRLAPEGGRKEQDVNQNLLESALFEIRLWFAVNLE